MTKTPPDCLLSHAGLVTPLAVWSSAIVATEERIALQLQELEARALADEMNAGQALADAEHRAELLDDGVRVRREREHVAALCQPWTCRLWPAPLDASLPSHERIPT